MRDKCREGERRCRRMRRKTICEVAVLQWNWVGLEQKLKQRLKTSSVDFEMNKWFITRLDRRHMTETHDRVTVFNKHLRLFQSVVVRQPTQAS